MASEEINDPDHHYDVYHESDSESLQINHSPRLQSDQFIEFDESPRDPTPEENEIPQTEDDDDNAVEDRVAIAIEEAFIEAPMTTIVQHPQILLSDDDELETIGSPPPTERDEKDPYYGYGYEQAIHEMDEHEEEGHDVEGNNDDEERSSLDRDYTQKSMVGGDGSEGNDDWAKRNQGARGKVSDLISRFNQGGDAQGSNHGTKQDYGSARQIGKIQQTKFR